MSHCRALMKPVDLRRSKKGFQIVHVCTSCGIVRHNIVALATEQDDFEAMLALMRQAHRSL